MATIAAKTKKAISPVRSELEQITGIKMKTGAKAQGFIKQLVDVAYDIVSEEDLDKVLSIHARKWLE